MMATTSHQHQPSAMVLEEPETAMTATTTTVVTSTPSTKTATVTTIRIRGEFSRHNSTPILSSISPRSDDGEDDEFHDLISLDNLSNESDVIQFSPKSQSHQAVTPAAVTSLQPVSISTILQDNECSPPLNFDSLMINDDILPGDVSLNEHGQSTSSSSMEQQWSEMPQQLVSCNFSPVSLVSTERSRQSAASDLSGILLQQQLDDDHHNNNQAEKMIPLMDRMSSGKAEISPIPNQFKNISAISFSTIMDDSRKIDDEENELGEHGISTAEFSSELTSPVSNTLKNHLSSPQLMKSAPEELTAEIINQTNPEVIAIGLTNDIIEMQPPAINMTKNYSSPQLIKREEQALLPAAPVVGKVGLIPRKPETVSSAGSSPKIAKKRRSNNFFQNIISPPYRFKAAEFHRLFAKEIPRNELLIAEFHCALNGCQGRIYISRDHFCFYCNIMGVYARNLTFNFSDVVSITKANSALVIPNALQIMIKSSSTTTSSTLPATATNNLEQQQRYLFTQFTQRDKTFALMDLVWRRSVNSCTDSAKNPLSNEEILDLIHKFYGDDLGFMNDHEETEFFSVRTQDESISGNPPPPPPPSETVIFAPTAVAATEDMTETTAAASLPPVQSAKIGDGETVLISPPPPPAAAAPDITANISLSSDQPAQTSSSDACSTASTLPLTSSGRFFAAASISQVEGACRCSDHKGTLVLDQIFPYPVDYLFELLFIDDNFSRFLHKKRHTIGVKINPWMPFDERHRPQIPVPEGDYDVSASEYRTLKYTLKVSGVPLVKSSLVHETQYILQSDSNRAYCLLSQAQNHNIPYSDCFLVATRWCLTSCLAPSSTTTAAAVAEDDENPLFPFHTRLHVQVDVHFIKSSFSLSLIKSSIEKNSVQGIREFLAEIAVLLRSNRFTDPLLNPAENQESLAPLPDADGERGALNDQEDDESSGSTSSSTDSDEPEAAGTLATGTKCKPFNRYFSPVYLVYRFGREVMNMGLHWPISESQLLKIVFIMLLAVIVINVSLLRQIQDVESRLGMMIDMIEARKSAAAAAAAAATNPNPF